MLYPCRHNKLRDVACISAKAEAGSGLECELQHTHSADILTSNWLCGKPAAFDLSVTSSLNPSFPSEVELRKHSANDAKCSEQGWTCIPLVVESYGAWGKEAVEAFSCLSPHHATCKDQHPQVQGGLRLYGYLNITLVPVSQCPGPPLMGLAHL